MKYRVVRLCYLVNAHTQKKNWPVNRSYVGLVSDNVTPLTCVQTLNDFMQGNTTVNAN